MSKINKIRDIADQAKVSYETSVDNTLGRSNVRKILMYLAIVIIVPLIIIKFIIPTFLVKTGLMNNAVFKLFSIAITLPILAKVLYVFNLDYIFKTLGLESNLATNLIIPMKSDIELMKGYYDLYNQANTEDMPYLRAYVLVILSLAVKVLVVGGIVYEFLKTRFMYGTPKIQLLHIAMVLGFVQLVLMRHFVIATIQKIQAVYIPVIWHKSPYIVSLVALGISIVFPILVLILSLTVGKSRIFGLAIVPVILLLTPIAVPIYSIFKSRDLCKVYTYMSMNDIDEFGNFS